jgi:hypothetical protein
MKILMLNAGISSCDPRRQWPQNAARDRCGVPAKARLWLQHNCKGLQVTAGKNDGRVAWYLGVIRDEVFGLEFACQVLHVSRGNVPFAFIAA